MNKGSILLLKILKRQLNIINIIGEIYMDINDYNKIIVDLIDFEIEMSSIAESRKTILKLQEKREILIKMKEQVRGDIRSTEVHYLSMRTSIRQEFSLENVDNSRKRKLLKGNKFSSYNAGQGHEKA